MATEKTCFKCLTPKPLTEFYKHAMMGDGHLNKCKECTKKDAAAHRLAKIEEVRAYDRRRASQPHRMAKQKAFNDRWKRQFPNRRRAQVMLGSALKSGKIQRLPCFVCGEDQNVEAHHPDYDAPLDVVWLCVPHHRQLHAGVR